MTGLQEVEPMFEISIPHPKHPLQKYSTKQLKAWYEACALYEAIHDNEYHETGKYNETAFHYLDIARWTRWDISDVLQKREVSEDELGQILRLVAQDVQA
jgi:hypothetical protein